jgi:serine/threonine protein kinase
MVDPSINALGRSWEAKKHTSAVGTLTYSSPEQRFKGIYNEKTDIFSLGIIFFELYYTCSTKMEKARVLSELRNRILPASFLQKYPAESAFILTMLQPNPDERPSVDDILNSDMLAEEYMTVHRNSFIDLEAALQKQRMVIEQQEEHIRMLEQKLAALAALQEIASPPVKMQIGM